MRQAFSTALLALMAAAVIVNSVDALRFPDVNQALELPRSIDVEVLLSTSPCLRTDRRIKCQHLAHLIVQGPRDFAEFGGCRLPDSDFLEGMPVGLYFLQNLL